MLVYHNKSSGKVTSDRPGGVPEKIHEWGEDGRHTLTDYTVSHPTASPYAEAAPRQQLYTAKRSEGGKVGQCAPACAGEGYAFTPIAFESFGAFGGPATAYLDRAAGIINNELPEDTVATWAAMPSRAFYAQRPPVALQRGNARAIRLRAMRDMRVDGRSGLDPPAHAH